MRTQNWPLDLTIWSLLVSLTSSFTEVCRQNQTGEWAQKEMEKQNWRKWVKITIFRFFVCLFFIKRKKKKEMIPELEWECGVKERFFLMVSDNRVRLYDGITVAEGGNYCKNRRPLPEESPWLEKWEGVQCTNARLGYEFKLFNHWNSRRERIWIKSVRFGTFCERLRKLSSGYFWLFSELGIKSSPEKRM